MNNAPLHRIADASDLPRIHALHDRVFGPGAHARTAYRVREGSPAVSPFCRIALWKGDLIAALRFTEVAIGGRGGALLLGPLAVAPDWAGKGHGKQLVRDGLAAAREAGRRIVVLVGDTGYYGQFGFQPVPPGQIVLPGPADPARILARALEPDALASYRGLVTSNTKER